MAGKTMMLVGAHFAKPRQIHNLKLSSYMVKPAYAFDMVRSLTAVNRESRQVVLRMYPNSVRVDGCSFEVLQGTGPIRKLGPYMMIRCNFELDIFFFDRIIVGARLFKNDPQFLQNGPGIFRGLVTPDVIQQVQRGIDTLGRIEKLTTGNENFKRRRPSNHTVLQTLLPAMSSLRYLLFACQQLTSGNNWRNDQWVTELFTGQANLLMNYLLYGHRPLGKQRIDNLLLMYQSMLEEIAHPRFENLTPQQRTTVANYVQEFLRGDVHSEDFRANVRNFIGWDLGTVLRAPATLGPLAADVADAAERGRLPFFGELSANFRHDHIPTNPVGAKPSFREKLKGMLRRSRKVSKLWRFS
ncbi:hypothetical protein ACO1O0_007570 [Amphichorda felina]